MLVYVLLLFSPHNINIIKPVIRFRHSIFHTDIDKRWIWKKDIFFSLYVFNCWWFVFGLFILYVIGYSYHWHCFCCCCYCCWVITRYFWYIWPLFASYIVFDISSALVLDSYNTKMLLRNFFYSPLFAKISSSALASALVLFFMPNSERYWRGWWSICCHCEKKNVCMTSAT